MGEKMKTYWQKAGTLKEKTGTFLKKVPKKVYIALIVLLIAAAGLVIWLNNRPYAVLFTDLNSSEVSSISSYLEKNGIQEYKIENSDTILVPENQEEKLKAKLLMEGYPQSGFSYTYPENSNIFSTESERKSMELRNLQDRMGAVIRCLDGVKDAAVTINAGDDSEYILDSKDALQASASVVVSMLDGLELNKEQADAIRNLMAHSVKGLNINSVNILDTAGNSYGTGDNVTNGDSSALKLQLEEEWENKIRTNVLQVLIPYYGKENVKVGVNCTVDVNQTVEDSTDVQLPDWAADGSTNGRGIVGSQIYNYVIVQDGNDKTGGLVGTPSNSEFPEYAEKLPELNGNESEIKVNGQIDYEHSKSKKHIIRTAGYLSDCMISVSINSTATGPVNETEIAQHVAKAAGIKGEYDKKTGREDLSSKISILAMPFYKDALVPQPGDPEFAIQSWMIYAGVIGAIFIVLLIVIIIVVVTRRKKAARLKKEKQNQEKYDIESMRAAAAVQPETPPNEGADIMNLKTEKSVEMRKNVRKFAEENPEIAAQMIKSWLKGEDENA